MTLYAASSDGTIAVFNFEPDEMEGIAPHSVQEQYLSKFNFVPPELPDGYSHNVAPTTIQVQTASIPNTFDSQMNGSGEQVNVLVANTKKKRANLTTRSSVPSAGGPPPPTSKIQAQVQQTFSSSNSFFPAPDEQPFGDVDMVSMDAFDLGHKGKGRATEEDVKPMYRTLGGDRPRQMIPIRELGNASASTNVIGQGQGGYLSGINLVVPAVMSKVSVPAEATNDGVFEAINGEEGNVLMFLENRKCLFMIDVLCRWCYRDYVC
jgi:protein HIRA/HIR1